MWDEDRARWEGRLSRRSPKDGYQINVITIVDSPKQVTNPSKIDVRGSFRAEAENPLIYGAACTCEDNILLGLAHKRHEFDALSVSSDEYDHNQLPAPNPSPSTSSPNSGRRRAHKTAQRYSFRRVGWGARKIEINKILCDAWRAKTNKARIWIARRVDDENLPGHPDFVPNESFHGERREIVYWSCKVAVEVACAWQRGERGREGGFYTEEEWRERLIGVGGVVDNEGLLGCGGWSNEDSGFEEGTAADECIFADGYGSDGA